MHGAARAGGPLYGVLDLGREKAWRLARRAARLEKGAGVCFVSVALCYPASQNKQTWHNTTHRRLVPMLFICTGVYVYIAIAALLASSMLHTFAAVGAPGTGLAATPARTDTAKAQTEPVSANGAATAQAPKVDRVGLLSDMA